MSGINEAGTRRSDRGTLLLVKIYERGTSAACSSPSACGTNHGDLVRFWKVPTGFSKDAQLASMGRPRLRGQARDRARVAAAPPERREQPLPRPRRLARDAGTNRSYCSLADDNPINLILDWSAPNGHHGSLRNCEGKAARYGPEVMDAVILAGRRGGPPRGLRHRRVGSACAVSL